MNDESLQTIRKWVSMKVAFHIGPDRTELQWQVRILYLYWTVTTNGELDQAIADADAQLTNYVEQTTQD